MANRELRISRTGDDVRELQRTLQNLGLYLDGKVDGNFGSRTARAVMAYQRSRGLAADAVVGPKTWARLAEDGTDHPPVKKDETLDPSSTSTGAPYLLFDIYPPDLDNPATSQIEDPPFETVIANHPHVLGGILKATDGLWYDQAWGGIWADWFRRNYRRLKELAGARYGKTWFRGSYHYLQFLVDGRAQADRYCDVVESAGGWDDGAIMPVVDIEDGGLREANRRANAQQLIDCANAFAERCKQRTGRRVMLYGRNSMDDRAIASKMGCSVAWNPSYTETMWTNGLVTVAGGKVGGWKLEEIGLWQYGGDGDGDADQHKLPLEIVGFGKVDMNVHINGAKAPTMATFRASIL